MKTFSLPDGEVICADVFEYKDNGQRYPLIICDPPYGRIVDEEWDDDVADYNKWMHHCQSKATEDATICMWGGIGKKGNRPFLVFAADVEQRFSQWEIKNWITWKKKRAYGVQDNYLFTREECLILTRGKPVFKVPYLNKKRGYAGYNKDYPAKNEFLRRTNVWTDVTELFAGKIHPCQKPDKLYEILIKAHTKAQEIVYDPCAGSLTTMRACVYSNRRFVCVEKETEYIDKAFELQKSREAEDAEDDSSD